MSKKPDDASKIAGLASILQKGNKEKEAPAAPPSPALPAAAPAAQPPDAPRRRKSGKLAKSRDPNFHHYGFYIRMDTHKQVKRRLEDTQPNKDVSDLMQELLEQWLASD